MPPEKAAETIILHLVPVDPMVPPSPAPPSSAPPSTAPLATPPPSPAPRSTAPRSTAPRATALLSSAARSTAPRSPAPKSTAPLSSALRSTAPLSSAPPSTACTPSSPPSFSTQKTQKQAKKRPHVKECKRHKYQKVFRYEKVVDKRVSNGKAEVKIRWSPCPECGKVWDDTWEPAAQYLL
ncbi:uncharacterized protein LOC129410286 [Boleophthalmus pectinirostris]|nr:uncharacterized protein LOC129410286 [Boleophthalmus pectinirostris]